MSDHRARYKNTALDAKELRRRREEDSFQLRKQKRDDVLSKKRTINQKEEFSEEENSIVEEAITPKVIAALTQNTDDQLLIDNAQRVRKILSIEPQPPFDEVIDSGLVPRIIELLDRHDNKLIQFEAAWILTNISSGTTDQTRVVVSHGAIPKLVKLCYSEDIKVAEQAVWALGNIIGDGPEFRDLVISHGFVPALLSLIRPDLDIGFLRNETWVLVNICRNKDPPPSFEVTKEIIPALNFLIQTTDHNILIDVTWALCYIAELGTNYSQLLIDSKLVERLIPYLIHDEIKIQTAALRSLGSIVTGTEEQTQVVIDAGTLPYLAKLLREAKDRVVKESLWLLSNIAAGSKVQIQALIDNQLIPLVVHHLDNGDWSQQKEAAWVIYNMTLSGNPKQLISLINDGALAPFCKLLCCKDPLIVRNAIEAFHYICSACNETDKRLLDKIEECGALDAIEKLQESPDADTSNFAYSIIDTYFSCEDEEQETDQEEEQKGPFNF